MSQHTKYLDQRSF